MLSDNGSPLCEMLPMTMAAQAIKLWKTSAPRSLAPNHFACGLTMKRNIAVVPIIQFSAVSMPRDQLCH